jgi:HEAT repeat protein
MSLLLPAVAPLLDSPIADLRHFAMRTIGAFGRAGAPRYGPELTPFLESDDPETRHQAAEALAAIDFQESIPAIERMIEAEVDEETRRFAEGALQFLKHPPAGLRETGLDGQATP